MDYTAHYMSPLGGLTMASDGTALIGLWFDNQRFHALCLSPEHEERPNLPLFEDVRRWLDAYFSGLKPEFTPPLTLRGTDFQKLVWNKLLEIPYGCTVTYGDIAHRLGCRSAQAVGGAVGHNNISLIIPCHRVVGADGSLTGYAAGIDKKRRLLQLESGLSL